MWFELGLELKLWLGSVVSVVSVVMTMSAIIVLCVCLCLCISVSLSSCPCPCLCPCPCPRLCPCLCLYLSLLPPKHDMIIVLCMETMPRFFPSRCSDVDPFFVAETVCNAWFTIEFVVRLASCPSKRSFFFDFKNVVDFVSVVPYYASLVLENGPDGGSEAGQLAPSCGSSNGGVSRPPHTNITLAYFRVIRLVRVVRILKLTKYCLGLQVNHDQTTHASLRLCVRLISILGT